MTLFYKHPVRPPELQILNILNKRMNLSLESQTRLHNLQKGFEGEVRFHRLLKKYLNSDCVVLYDLHLESKKSTFQIDCIIIQQSNIWYLEIKNFEGDFVFKDNELYSLKTSKEINNPLNQVSRGKQLLKELQESFGYTFPVKSYVVFVNNEFTLYQSHTDLPFIFPGQNRRLIKKISGERSKLTSAHYKLAKALLSSQTNQSVYERLPEYYLNSLKKGIYCLHCKNNLLEGSGIHGKKLICVKCAMVESRESAILRNVDDFTMLFPETKITTAGVWEWCDAIISRYKIRKVLFQYLKPVGNQSSVYFISHFKNRI